MSNRRRILTLVVGTELILLTFFLFLYWDGSQENTKVLNWIFIHLDYLFFNFLGIIVGFLFLRSYKRSELLSKYRIIGDSKNVFSMMHLSMYYWLLRLTMSSFIIAAALPSGIDQPYADGKAMEIQNAMKDKEIIFCLDLSKSMDVRDLGNSTRLESAKRILKEIVSNLENEKIGLCVFAGLSKREIESTRNKKYLLKKLNSLETDFYLNSSQGTDLWMALQTSQEMFTTKYAAKGIILITDGENFSNDALDIPEQLRNQGISPFFIGVGTQGGGFVPGYEGNKEAISKLNSTMLKEIAKESNGRAFIYSEEYPDLEKLLTEINQIKSKKSGNLEVMLEDNTLLNIFIWTAFFGFCLLLVYPLIIRRS